MDTIDLAKSTEQEKLAKYKIEMQEVRQLFIKATGAFFVIWYNSTARHYVVSGSQNSISLGKDQLAQLKAKLKDLTDNGRNVLMIFSPRILYGVIYHQKVRTIMFLLIRNMEVNILR